MVAAFWIRGRRPPLVAVDTIPFEMSQARIGALYTLGLAVAAGCVVATWLRAMLGGERYSTGGLAVVAVFAAATGLGAVVSLWRIVSPNTISLTADGFTYRSLWRSATWRWADVWDFRLVGAPIRLRGTRDKVVAFASDGPRAPGLLAPTTLDADWPDLRATGFVSLMNHAKQRFGGADARQTLDRPKPTINLDTV